MSDRLKDLELELRQVVAVLNDVSGSQWYDIGLELRLAPSTLDSITSHPDIESHKRMMLRKWLQEDPEATWEKLACALAHTGYKTIAAKIRSQFVRIVAEAAQDKERQDETEISLAMRQAIRGHFTSLLDKAQSALQSHHVSVDRVRNFLIRYFQCDSWAHNISDLSELFNAVSVAKLWNFDHYGPLEEVMKQILPNDSTVKALLSEYKGQLNGYYTATKLSDFIKQSKLKDSDQNPQQPLAVKSFTLQDYRKLKLRLKLDRKISAVTLSHVDELWRSLAEEFDLPSLTAVIHSIVEGSVSITWLILPHIEKKIRIAYSKALRFYQKHNIAEIYIDDDLLYNEEWIEGSTLLYQASFMGNTDEVKDLLASGGDVNQRNSNEWRETALFGACLCGHADIAKVLLKHGAFIHYLSKDRQSALWFASSGGHTETIEVLLQHGAQVNQSNNDELGSTALIGACQNGHSDTVRVLLKHGAIVDKQNKYGESALWYASSAGYAGVVKVLLEFGAHANLPTDWDNNTALIIACQNGYSDIAKELLDHGAVVNYQNENGETPLTEACYHGKLETVITLLRAGAKTDIQDKYGGTGLIWACSKGYIHIVKALLEAKADSNVTNENGWTALFFATTRGHLDVVKMLADYGTIMDLRDEYGLTALDYANDHPSVYDVLEQYTLQDSEARTIVAEDQRSTLKHSIGWKILKVVEKTFLKEQFKKREHQLKKGFQGNEVQHRNKPSLGHHGRQGQTMKTALAANHEKYYS